MTERAAEPRYAFTVFTPTYNRAHTLPRVFESLAAQSFRDFEWLIVDDGSTDETRELIDGWQATAPFRVRCISQENQGKHMAHNAAIAAAEGRLFLSLDSDDACVPEALERLMLHWQAIPPAERDGFSAVTVLCRDQHGQLVGDRFPQDVMDTTVAEMTYRHRVRGEKWGFQRTDILRQFPFTADPNSGYVPEGLVWQQVGIGYKVRYVNEALRIYFVDGPSLTRGRNPAADSYGRRLFYTAELNSQIGYLWVAPAMFFKSGVQYARASLHQGVPLGRQLGALSSWRARVLWALALPAALVLWSRDRRAP